MSNEEEKEEEDVGGHAGLSEPGVPGVPGPWHPQILAHQLTLSQPEGSNYAHHITKGQSISKANFLVLIWTMNWTKLFFISALAFK